MKLTLPLAACSVFIAGIFLPNHTQSAKVTLVVGGDTLGYLAPCGCSEPMIGGIKRWAEQIRSLRGSQESVVVFNGGLVGGTGRQDELKVEMLAESFALLDVSAVNLTLKEAQLGRGELATLSRLSGRALVATSLEPSETLESKSFAVAGPFLIGAIDADADRLASKLGETAISTQTAVENLVEESEALGKKPVLLAYVDLAAARVLAQKNGKLGVIVYRSDSPERSGPLVENGVTLVSPGTKGRYLVSIDWDGTTLSNYRALALGPETVDHADIARFYGRYLERVGSEKLLEMVPRTTTGTYVGSKACSTCHSKAAKVWKETAHYHGLETLEHEGHDKDPDCVGCHVVGLDSESGFRSREMTPNMAAIGCESCHGPGAAHVSKPQRAEMPKVAPTTCVKCHGSENSPNFDFSKYWAKIKH